MNWQAVFFDFDGVILDSVNVKTDAFASMFEVYGPEVRDAVVKYHLENGGVSRMEKFKYYYKHILHKGLSHKKLEQLCREFSDLVVTKVIASEYIPGALETLASLKVHKIPAFVVSGTPQDEIDLIVTQKGLADYFREVHGSPRNKEDIVRDILTRKGYDPSACLLIGDSMSDYKAAGFNGIHFLGIVSDPGASLFPSGTKISSRVSVGSNLDL